VAYATRLVFSIDFKMLKLSPHLMYTGKEFQTVGAATAKAQAAPLTWSNSREVDQLKMKLLLLVVVIVVVVVVVVVVVPSRHVPKVYLLGNWKISQLNRN